MPRIIIAPEARNDLDAILSYIAQDNPDAAKKLLATLKDKFVLLASSPRIGMLKKTLQPDILGFPIGNYVIFYREIQNGIEVARVLHGARDIERLF